MGACLVLTPLIIASWPVITAAVTAAVTSMGFSLASKTTSQQAEEKAQTRTEMEVQDSEILEAGGATGEELVVEREGIRGVFQRDARGALRLCMEGYGHTETELRRIGEELIGRVTQQYAYHRIVTELQQRNMAIVEEHVGEDRVVRIRVRSR
jgi:hypothetical protein